MQMFAIGAFAAFAQQPARADPVHGTT
jgi:hypothetical protein